MKSWPFNEANQSWRRLDRMKRPSTWGHPSLNVDQAFLRVQQRLYPHERLDAVPGHHPHFTQLPRNEKMKQTIGLSKGFHVSIFFDIGLKNMSKRDAWNTCIDRLHKMNIVLGTNNSNTQYILVWAKSQRIGWTFSSYISRTFSMMDKHYWEENVHLWWNLKGESGSFGETEKDFELGIEAQNLWLGIKGDKLRNYTTHNIFNTLVHKSCYGGQQLEFLKLPRSTPGGETNPPTSSGGVSISYLTMEALTVLN